MLPTLEMLHDILCKLPIDTPEQQQITQNHQHLVRALTKKQRRRVLRIIDDEDNLRLQVSLDSFAVGLRLGLGIANELNQMTGGNPAGTFAGEDSRPFASDEE